MVLVTVVVVVCQDDAVGYYYCGDVSRGCCWLLLLWCAGEEAGLCVPREVCRGAAGPRSTLHQHLPAGTKGDSHSVSTFCLGYTILHMV